MNIQPVVSVGNDKIYPLIFDELTIDKFWNQAKQFPTLYGHEIHDNIDTFIDLFFQRDGTTLVPYGLFWVLNPEEFTGVFYLTELIEQEDGYSDAHAHYTFFDRRHRGRVPLVKEMLNFWFDKYKFERLSAAIPNYVTPQARHFAMECGMKYEGKRRGAAKYKDEWFDINLYGILRKEALNGQGR